ncbi:GSU2403 family nucleotidyltransferase fold protein [Sphingosinicella microcystinivorans]|uniref:nucleotidyltransferase family protein n=1 Tax=Sphingosinicella microcystinivorans TaxID=335406 RepID=UPI0022F39946|nr:GSU2403 family nucleotidyltransferase fold protein [Sphingosinicella microcystinivorans]WBX84431.1 GSU2403 family nucleotidyltransferase fold protein [Sphingosinicella microcystinivorans]
MSKPRRHSLTAQTAYHELVSLLLDDAASDIRGSPTLRVRGERRYWYDRYRIGTDTRERYLGEDNEALRQRIERHEQLKAQQEERRAERARLVRLLRSERLLGMDNLSGSLVAAMSKAGVFRLGGVLVGTTAFRFYEGELGLRLSFDQTTRTQDIDIASFERLSLAISDTVEPSLVDVFSDLDFTPVPGLDHNKTWRWKQSRGAALVEFLTPSFDAEESLRDLAALGVSAQSLHYLNYVLAEPIDAAAVYREGVLVKIPRPERFAIHKLIVADRRREGPDSFKSRKDLMQAEFLIAVLAEDRPEDLQNACQNALERGPRWRERIERSLTRIPDAARYMQDIR